MNGKVVVITGAASGLGAGMARGLARKGARVALLDVTAGTPLEAVAADCPGSRTWAVDVRDRAALKQVADEVVTHFGRVDVVVANAGVGGGGPFLLQDEEEFDRILEVNLNGSIHTARAFLPALVESKGHLLQIASLAAIAPAAFMSSYCASKSGVEAFAHCLRGELAHHGVTVGVAYLGFTDTAMVRAVDEDPVLGTMRSSLPWPLSATAPAGPAVARLVKGIEQRKPHVYAQPWLRAMPLLRGALPNLAARAGKDHARQGEEMIRARG